MPAPRHSLAPTDPRAFSVGERASKASRGGGVALALAATAVLAAALIALPLVAVMVSLLSTPADSARAFLGSVLGRTVANAAMLAAIVGVGTAVIGTGTAWLVTLCRFPGRRAMTVLLVLPLTLPAYVVAYAYTDVLQHSGPVQTALRTLFALPPRASTLPNIRSLGGAGLVFTMVFYPYVFLIARAAFLRQSGRAFEAARMLGAGPWLAFWRVALPAARPAVAAGVAIAIMETLADYGAVAHFGVPTFTTTIYSTWFALGDKAAAMQLSAILLIFVLALVTLEAKGRRGVTFAKRSDLARMELSGMRGVAALGGCILPVLLGFAAPLLVLTEMALPRFSLLIERRYLTLLVNTVSLSVLAALLTGALAVLLAYAARLTVNRPGGRVIQGLVRFSGLGYALPGTIVAVGLLVPLAGLDNAIDAAARARFGVSTGLILTGSVAALVYAYAVRFAAVALGPVEAGLAKVTPSIEGAARLLDAGPRRVLTQVHLPIIRGSVLTALLLVFVETMKELPATLILRPFNFDTLAVQAHRLASDERLAEAAVPSLVIALVGLVPVLLLGRQMSRR